MDNQLPNGWVYVKLEDCSCILDSRRIPVNNDERQKRIEGKKLEELFPYYGATGEVGKIDSYIFDEELVALGEDGIPFFDLMKPKAYFLQGKTWVNNHAHILKGIDGILLNKYLLYFLNQFDYQDYVNGGTRLKLTQANMRRIPVLLPPLAEQKEIAARLDDLLAQVDTLKTRLDSIPNILKRFRQSVLAAAVSGKLTEEWRAIKSITSDSWKQIKISDIVASIDSGKNLKCIERPPMNDEYGIIKISAVTWGVYNEEESKTLPNARDFIKSKRVIEGDFLISRANTIDLLGSPVIVQCTTKNLMLSDKVWRLDISNDHKKWLWLYLKSIVGRKKIEERSTGNQMSMRNIGQSAFLSIEMLLPSLEEQTEIVRRVEELFAFADQVEQQVKAAQQRVNHLTQAILAKAFRGELTAQWREQHPDLISGENSAAALLARIKAEKQLRQIVAKPSRRQTTSLELDTTDFIFDREDANQR